MIPIPDRSGRLAALKRITTSAIGIPEQLSFRVAQGRTAFKGKLLAASHQDWGSGGKVKGLAEPEMPVICALRLGGQVPGCQDQAKAQEQELIFHGSRLMVTRQRLRKAWEEEAKIRLFPVHPGLEGIKKVACPNNRQATFHIDKCYHFFGQRPGVYGAPLASSSSSRALTRVSIARRSVMNASN